MSGFHRRDFLKRSGLSIGAVPALAQSRSAKRVALVLDPSDPLASTAPVRWAAQELKRSLAESGILVNQYESIKPVPPGDSLMVTTAGQASNTPETLGLTELTRNGHRVLQASGSDSRGLMYALLELADRVQHATDPLAALHVPTPIVEHAANKIRSIARLFVSDVEDKPWFNDREMWPKYLTMLASQRFNRFNLSLGIGYDFLREVTDAYFLFAYPFFLSVPGYSVRAVNLPDSERDRNLEMLKFISDQTVARGLDFQLGIWMHGYQWTNSPRANYTIEGLTPENHAGYCRDALTALLRACPGISGVTFRIHGESGIAEGSYSFWKTVFDGVVASGRKVEIDMHTKGLDQKLIDVALATGMPVKISPKFVAEHMGMPYHHASIRDQEMPRAERNSQGFFALSSGSRSFTRYGYGDFLREERRYGIVHRIWSGTRRILLWGDPVTAAAYSRAFSFCSTDGVELMEPLSFKGRRGSGLRGDRCGYADASLAPRWDWEKSLYTYRVWGRKLFNPDAEPDVWHRYLRQNFQSASPDVEAALANASRILPLITTAHGPSAANNNYWPEIYTNQPIVKPKKDQYSDTPSPKVFGNVSPFDPQLFSRINDFADELLKGERSGKYSPIEAAQWLEDYSNRALKHLAGAGHQNSPAFRRMALDVTIQAGIGRFFAAKFRSAVLYAIHERTGDRSALEEALKTYRSARASWAEFAEKAKGVYVSDITAGEHPWLRGHWLDRLAAIDDDIADMAKRLDSTKPSNTDIGAILRPPLRPAGGCRHSPPTRFHPGKALDIEIQMLQPVKQARLYYRHVNQAERFQVADMQPANDRHLATIPATYTGSPYPLQYYFELRASPDKAWLYPGFAPDLANQPYFVVRSV